MLGVPHPPRAGPGKWAKLLLDRDPERLHAQSLCWGTRKAGALGQECRRGAVPRMGAGVGGERLPGFCRFPGGRVCGGLGVASRWVMTGKDEQEDTEKADSSP